MVSFQPLLTRLHQRIEEFDHVLEPLRDLHLRYKHRESCLYVRARSVMVYKTVSVHQPASKDLWQVLLMQEGTLETAAAARKAVNDTIIGRTLLALQMHNDFEI